MGSWTEFSTVKALPERGVGLSDLQTEQELFQQIQTLEREIGKLRFLMQKH